MTLARFIELWTSTDYPPERVTEVDLRNIEQRLDFLLPDDYRRAVLETGLPRPTVALMDAIIERHLELNCLGDFYSPAEIIEETVGWRAIGMPKSLVAFASDGCGNKFCFDTDRLNRGGREGRAIWFYDHDFGTVEQIAATFDDWMDAFCQVEPWSDVDPT
ncbi:SMI1/KNR4 family protein [Sphingomonas sp. MMSM20]|uniref:SMI1/KNR4 family protein n=1 Tax=Sphingomonas lycopersici TaxID=2951807 RepID=UPI002237DFAC|nr:SMI1/KNR4 family protein [Sphingomonas lycopersici]MCW6531105.1 SMI1/KNR4 family protein [Sphingomonas lycopersici]